MAFLTGPQVYQLKVRLADFKKNVETYVRTIDQQAFASVALSGEQRAARARFDRAKGVMKNSIDLLNRVILTGTIDGSILTDDAVRSLVSSFEPQLQEMQSAVVEWNKVAPLGGVLGTIDSLNRAVFGSMSAVFDLVGGGFSTLKTAAQWLPWVILAAIVVPPALRVIVAGRRKGFDAALDEAAERMDEGKRKVTDAAKAAGNAVVTAGKFLLV